MNKKALWIAEQGNFNADDVYDVLLGYITAPRSFVQEVMALSNDYDMEFEEWSRKVNSSLGDSVKTNGLT